MIVGIDFGTTNSLVTFIENMDGERAIPLLHEGEPHPSILWLEGQNVVAGKHAKDLLRSGDVVYSGNIIRSPKLLLGKGNTIRVAGRDRTPAELASELLKFLRNHATEKMGGRQSFKEAVITIPVTMQGPGRKALREAARLAGFGIVQFVHEPLAALYAYFRQNPNREEEIHRLENRVVLVFDWGGGTLDMTLVRVRERNLCQILNMGLEHVGGDEFDRELMRMLQKRFLELQGVQDGDILPTRDKVLLDQCEQAKIALSTRTEYPVFVSNFARINGKTKDLDMTLTRRDIEEATRGLVDQGMTNLRLLLDRSSISPNDVELCLATGGMALMPVIYDRLIEIFDGARVPKPSVVGSATLISEGAAWIAHDKTRLTLAKPIELELASGRYLPLLKEGIQLPQGEKHVTLGPLTFYCTDPSDGNAKFVLTRPRWPGHITNGATRDPYMEMLLDVDPGVPGLFQRLKLQLHVDQDLIVAITCEAIGPNYETYSSNTKEIHDLEFGVMLPSQAVNGDKQVSYRPITNLPGQTKKTGGIALKSNVSDKERRWADVPGDVIGRYYPLYFDPRISNPGTYEEELLLRRQLQERDYYRSSNRV